MSNLWLCPRCDTHFVPLKKMNRNGAGLSVPTPRSGRTDAHPDLWGIHFYPSQIPVPMTDLDMKLIP